MRSSLAPLHRPALAIALTALILSLGMLAAACSDDSYSANSTAPPASSLEGPTKERALGPDDLGTEVTTGNGDAYMDITPGELASMLEDKNFLLINTHVPYVSDIPQTDQFIPYDQAADRLDELPAYKNAKIVVYCQSDNMSRKAIKVWAAAGYSNLVNLDGGFLAWQDAGYALVQNDWGE